MKTTAFFLSMLLMMLLSRMTTIVPMVNDFLDAKPQSNSYLFKKNAIRPTQQCY
jgi:hypothetical protein